MLVEVHHASILQKVLLKRREMFNVEDSLLSLASSGTTDGIFYCTILRIGIDDSVYVARYFESGAFLGFYAGEMHREVKEKLGVHQLLPYSVYTHADIAADFKRDEALYMNRKTPGSKLFLF